MNAVYDPATVESQAQQYWNEHESFRATESEGGQ